MCYFLADVWEGLSRSWQGNRCATHHPTHHFGTRQMTMATQDIDLAMKKNDGRFQKRVEKMPPSAQGGLLRGKLIWPMMLCQGGAGSWFLPTKFFSKTSLHVGNALSEFHPKSSFVDQLQMEKKHHKAWMIRLFEISQGTPFLTLANQILGT